MTKSLSALTVTAVLLVVVAPVGIGQEKAAPPGSTTFQVKRIAGKAPSSRTEVFTYLEMQIDTKDFYQAGERTLEECLGLFADKLHDRRLELPILVDIEAFTEANPDAQDVLKTAIKFPQYPQRMTVADALSFVLSRVPTNNATFVVRRSHIEITTLERASIGGLLGKKVLARYDKKPLAEVLSDLAERAGVTVMLDERVGDKRNFRISAQFANDVTFRGALRAVTEVAGLKLILMDSVLLVTTPELAENLAKDKQRGWNLPS